MIKRAVDLIPNVPVSQLVHLGQEAERLGYDKCWMYDEGLATRDVYVSLAAIAMKTSIIHLGTGITNPFTRHPGVTASAIATLDELTGGRTFLGLGAGGTLTLASLSIERTKPLTAVREMIETTRGLFRGESVTYQGEVVHMNQARITYGRPDIPIWIAGRGNKMLSLGGEMADGVVLEFIHKNYLQSYVDLVTEGAKRTGNRPKICYSTMIITNERVLEELRPHMTYRLVDSPPEVKQRLGILPEEIEAIRTTMGSRGLVEAGKLIKDEWIRPFVIIGTQSECAKELAEIMACYHFDEFLLPILESKTAIELMTEVSKVLEMA